MAYQRMWSCLAGQRPARAAAEVVGPDDLVEEGAAAEEVVERDLAIVDFAVVEVDEERARGFEDAPRLFEPGDEEAGVVIMGVAVGKAAEFFAAVALIAEAGAPALGVAPGTGGSCAPACGPC